MTEAAHIKSGTDYGKDAAKYATVRHGPDGAKFLDPVFLPYLDNLNGQSVIDIGCGAGPWAIYAAKQGAKVLAVDYQMGMLRQAEQALTQETIKDNVNLVQADGGMLPTTNNIYDLALSINVGCNLPTKVFNLHFAEIARVLKPESRAVVTAPTNFGVVFTQGSRQKDEVLYDINHALSIIVNSQESKIIKEQLDKLNDVYRATFARRNNQWVLITNESKLISGETIWRKLPGLMVPNFYHSQHEYVEVAEEAGLKVVEQKSLSFSTEEERENYNKSVSKDQQLGPEYVGKSPFVVFVLNKPLLKVK